MNIWDTAGSDKYYEHYRISTRSEDLRKWVDEAYTKLSPFLDKSYLKNLRNNDFYGRLWELELAKWLMLTDLKMAPTNGAGFDFCVELKSGSKIWIEAVYSRPDEELREIEKAALESSGVAYDTPREQVALRYSSSLFEKANKINKKYTKYIGKNDYVLIAISSFAPDAGMWKDRDIFQLAVLPIGNQLFHISVDGRKLDNTPRPSHEVKLEMTKATGVPVKKGFLYPGTKFPHIDGVMFSEASNLQQLLGMSSISFCEETGKPYISFNEETNTPHIYQNYSGKDVPGEFTKFFYYHKWRKNSQMVTLDMVHPIVKLGSTRS